MSKKSSGRAARRQTKKYTRRARKGFLAEAAIQVAAGNWGIWETRNLKEIPPELQANKTRPDRLLVNNLYSVQVFTSLTKWGWITHLAIRRHELPGYQKTEAPDIPFWHKQRIKNEICGLEYAAVEVFPAQENLIDQADLYHLWVLPKDFEVPFGLHLKSWSRTGVGKWLQN